jgi:tripeptide aminopeptidase
MQNLMKEKLLNVLSIQSESYDVTRMNEFIINQVIEMGLIPVIEKDNIYVTKGNAINYPCIVSHTDSVHKIIPDEDYTILHDDNMAMGFNKRIKSPSGCGGDDKVGIFICLELLRDMQDIKVAFFRDEEVGCDGSYDANMEFFNDVRFILQCDRKGNNDFVNEIYGAQLQSKRFKKDVSKIISLYGYHFASGMLTDVYALNQSGVGVSVANMSCGYYNPHCDDEVVMFDDVENCLMMCRDIMMSMTSVYECAYTPKKTYPTSYMSKYSSYYDWDGWSDDYTSANKNANEWSKCQACDESIEAKYLTYSRDFNCDVCDSCSKWMSNM